MKKRLLSILLTLVMMIGLLPITVQAAQPDEKAIQLGIGSITGYSAEKGYDYLYIGDYNPPGLTKFYPIKWRVLDTKTNMEGSTEGDGLFLLSDYVLKLFEEPDMYMFDLPNGYHWYDNADGATECHRGAEPSDGDHSKCVYSNAWQGSAIQKFLQVEEEYPVYISSVESAAMLETTKSDTAFVNTSQMEYLTVTLPVGASENILNGDKLFYLSAEEATNSVYGFSDPASRIGYTIGYLYEEPTASHWCLRSPLVPNDSTTLGHVNNLGDAVGVIDGQYGAMLPAPASDTYDIARPAFNLDIDSVLFISAFDRENAEDAKDSPIGQLTKIGTCGELSDPTDEDYPVNYTGRDWMPTLKDSTRHFSVTESAATVKPGDNITLNYTGAIINDEAEEYTEYISAILADSTGTAMYYGRLQKSTTTDGAVDITIPADLADGSYTLHVFNEGYHETWEGSHIASAFEDVALTVFGSTPVIPVKPENPFVDVHSNAYFADAVLWATEKNITGGVNATHFAPDRTCTRAQAVTFLWRAAGCPASKSITMPFTDVSAGSYYYDAVLWAVENGITKGTNDTTFSPDLECSRAQIVTFLWRSQNSLVVTAANPFTDVKANAYYTNAVLWAAKNGITGGTTATTFSPDLDCTRAQIVTFIYRCMK